MSVEEAARRRDFTINAMAWDPLTGAYLDPFDGRGDIERRVLRVVDSTRFADDSLRVLRAVQFAARLDFTLDQEARQLCRSIPLDDLPAERVWGELDKLLFAPRPSIGFSSPWIWASWRRCSPTSCPGGVSTGTGVASEGDVWVPRCRSSIRRASASRTWSGHGRSRSCSARCVTTSETGDNRGDRRPHSLAGSRGTGCRAHRVLPRSLERLVHGRLRPQAAGGRPRCPAPQAGLLVPCETRLATARSGGSAQKVDLELLARLAKADCLGRSPGRFDCTAMDWFLDRARSLGVEHRPPAPILLGRHVLALGATPGPRVGRILKAVYERQLDGTVTDLEQAIAAAQRMMEDASR